MPLLDHFHPPLRGRHQWHSFHSAWATYLAAALNKILPKDYFAASNVQFAIEIDTAVLREQAVVYDVTPVAVAGNGMNGIALSGEWIPPTPTQTIAFEPTEHMVEVLVYYEFGGPTLVGALELVSSANKDRPAQRTAFTAKCENYLRTGVGLLIVDVVTERKTNLHKALMLRLNHADTTFRQETLYTAAYHVVQHNHQPTLDIWYETLTLDHVLPTMPLWLRDGPCMPVELEATYQRTCKEQRISTEPIQER